MCSQVSDGDVRRMDNVDLYIIQAIALFRIRAPSHIVCDLGHLVRVRIDEACSCARRFSDGDAGEMDDVDLYIIEAIVCIVILFAVVSCFCPSECLFRSLCVCPFSVFCCLCLCLVFSFSLCVALSVSFCV